MTDQQALPDEVRRSLDVWLDAHDRLSPGLIEGLYVVGSSALGDHQQQSDIDIIAFTADPTDAQTVETLESAHDAARAELGADVVDGPRLGWADVSLPPMPALRAWTLDGEFHFDGDCFVINPVTWLVLDRYGVAVRGPSADQLDVAVDTADMRTFVRENVDTYWRSVGEQIRDALADPERTDFVAGAAEWAALGAVRMLYTTVTGDVTSKSAAGEWAIGRLPEHEHALRTAIELRRSGETTDIERGTVRAIADLVDDVVARVTGAGPGARTGRSVGSRTRPSRSAARRSHPR